MNIVCGWRGLLVLVCVSWWVLVVGRVAPAGAQEQPFVLRILHTNDHHARLEPVEVTDRGELGGIARRKTLVEQLRADSAARGEGVLLLDAGDVFQGTLYFNQYLGQADLFFYNALGYNALAIGNHEFDRGPQPLADFIAGATFPVLSTNITVADGAPLSGKIPPWVTLEVNGERVGIFGLTPPDTAILSSPGEGITFSDPVAAAQQAVNELTNQGINKIVGLTHVGITVDQQIARSVNGIDIIVGGHSHTPLGNQPGAMLPYPIEITASDGGRTLVVTNWEWGKYLGDIRLTFDGNGVVTGWEGQPHPVDASIAPDPEVAAKLAEYAGPIEQLRQSVLGQTTRVLDGDRVRVRSQETNLANLIADAMLNRMRADGGQVALQNGGGIRASIPAGNVTVAQVLEVLPFGNTIARVDLTGAQLRAALEHGLSEVEAGAGRFPQVAGMRYTWDPTAAVGARVVEVLVADGSDTWQPLDEQATYRVVTNDFLLRGGDGYQVFTEGQNPLDTGIILADAVMEYMTAHTPLNGMTDERIDVAEVALPVLTPAVVATGQSAPLPVPTATGQPLVGTDTGPPPQSSVAIALIMILLLVGVTSLVAVGVVRRRRG